MVLGVYYLTNERPGALGEGRAFGSIKEVLFAYDMDYVETRTPIRLYYSGPVIDLTISGDSHRTSARPSRCSTRSSTSRRRSGG